MAIQTNFPAVKPALLLDFAKNKRLDSRITFTRTTTATYYDGVTTAKAEENLLVQSQDFTTTWGPTNITVTANTTTAPDGTSTADTLTGSNSTNNNKYIVQTIGTISGNYTFSFFAKANTHNIIQVLFFGGVTPSFGGYVNYDLSTGTLGSYDAVGTPTIINVGNGWYRCIYSTIFTLQTYAVITLIDSTTASRFATSASTNSIYIWGAQLEQRSSVTAYTATTTQPITNYIPVLLTAASGVARFDHNPTTDESLGLLIEEQRTNLLTYSANFSNAAWSKTRSSITSDTIVAPDGTLTGDKLVEDTTASNTHNTASGNISFTSGTSYSFSVYAKAGERTVFRSQLPTAAFGAYVAYNFDLSAGTVTLVTAGTGNSASITSVGNGWYRCTTVAQATATASGSVVIFLMSGATITYTGNGYSGIYIWGAQLEAGAFATSYIATTSATVTRNADAASMTDSNFTSWFNNAEGTLYAEHQKLGTATFQRVVGMSDGGFNNRIYIGYGSGNPNNLEAIVTVSGVSQAGFVVVTSSAINTSYKVATAYATNNFAGVANAGTVGTDAIGTIPVVNRLNIGIGDNTSSNPLNGTIKKVAYYPVRITNANLQALTS